MVINTKYTYTKNESKQSEMGPVRESPIQTSVRSIHMQLKRKLNIYTNYT